LRISGNLVRGRTSITVDPDTGLIKRVAPIVTEMVVKEGIDFSSLKKTIKAECPVCGHFDSVDRFEVLFQCYFTGSAATHQIMVEVAPRRAVSFRVSDDVVSENIKMPPNYKEVLRSIVNARGNS